MNGGDNHLVVTRGPGEGREISLAKLPLTMGRLQSCDAVFDAGGVSRTHARISEAPEGYVLEDLGSSNGTYINGTRIEGPNYILNGDRIRLGSDVELVAVVEPVPVPPPAAEPITPSASGQTMAGESALGRTARLNQGAPAAPPAPRLVVHESGREPTTYPLTADRIRIGRQPDNDVVIENRYVSRYHAELERQGDDFVLIPSPSISNSLLLDGQPVMEPVRLHDGAKVRMGGFAPGEIVTLEFLLSAAGAAPAPVQITQFAEDRVVSIGRGTDNDIVLPSPLVSRYHAEVEKIGQRYRLRDLKSNNGTFVNGQTVAGDTWVHPGDAIQIGPYRFVVAQDQFAQYDQSAGGVLVEAFGLNKWVSRELNILQNISLIFQPREFIVVVGQSGGGKSTLVDAIAGYRPATHGKVVINGTVDVYKEFNVIRSTIGYVPQRDIIHMELTVFEALDYSARLRMPPDTTAEERAQRVQEVMEELDLAHRRDTVISRLSGGQQKRVSIGVELLTKPGLFFLDEPTSGLDPGTETELMRLMRRLADQGRTIVMITHATKNVMLADKVVFLARGGYLAWFGPPEEALAYFDQYRSEKDRRSSPMAFDTIYTLLERDQLGGGQDWAQRFRSHPAYGEYIAAPLKLPEPYRKEETLAGQKSARDAQSQVASKPLARPRQISSLRQFFILSARHLKITVRDRFSLALLLVTAPLLASLDFLIASGIGRDPFSFATGSFNNVAVTLISLSNTTILVGGLACMRELVKERDVYRRERMVNLRLLPYLLSKIWLALFLGLYMAACFTIVRYLAFKMPGGFEDMIFFYITVFLLIVAGMMLGFFASALAPNSNAAPLLLILFIIPQMVLSGGLIPLPDSVKAVASSSWAMRSAFAISGIGSDVAADSCWALPREQQDQLTLAQKNQQCTCMGENALREASCNFPGLGQYYDPAIDQADPSPPSAPGAQPPQPSLPPAPTAPQNISDPVAVAKFLNDLSAYKETVNQAQYDYALQVSGWQQQQQAYLTGLQTYQQNLGTLEGRRTLAVGSAESMIRRFKTDFGWAFVSKKDHPAYLRYLYRTWGAQLVIITVLFVATLLVQKRRDLV